MRKPTEKPPISLSERFRQYTRSVAFATGLAALATGCAPGKTPQENCAIAYHTAGEQLGLSRDNINNLVNSCVADTVNGNSTYLSRVIPQNTTPSNTCSTVIGRAATATGVSPQARSQQIDLCSAVIPRTTPNLNNQPSQLSQERIQRVANRVKNSLRSEFIKRRNTDEQNRHNEAKINDLVNLAEELLRGGSLRYRSNGSNFSRVCMETSDRLVESGVSRDTALSFSQMCHDSLENSQRVTVLAVGAGVATSSGNGAGAVLALSSQGVGVGGGFQVGQTTVIGGAGAGGERF